MNRSVARIFWFIHRSVYRGSGGRIGKGWFKVPSLLLTTTGRVSGKTRPIVLSYFPDDDRYVVVASNLGSTDDPQWRKNLQANAKAEVWIGSERRQVQAQDATEEERSRLWPIIAAANPQYDQYRESAGRQIPLIVLQPS